MDEHDHEHGTEEQADEGIVEKIKDVVGWE